MMTVYETGGLVFGTLLLLALNMWAFIVRSRAAKGTRLRYIATTWLILVEVGMEIWWLMLATVMIAEENYWQAGLCAFNVLAIGYNLWRVLTKDDDHWFGDQWKKLKRWVRDIRTSHRTKPAFA